MQTSTVEYQTYKSQYPEYGPTTNNYAGRSPSMKIAEMDHLVNEVSAQNRKSLFSESCRGINFLQ